LEKNRRILIVDDNEAIHSDFRKILGIDESQIAFDAEEAEVLGATGATKRRRSQFELDFAFQGEEALQSVQAAVKARRRYAMVFMDVQMPPGWDGLETTRKSWEADPDLQVVLCTAFSDRSWEEMMEMIGFPERLLILKKPFDAIEVLQLAHALTEKWSLLQSARSNTVALERVVEERTGELQGINEILQREIVMRKTSEEVVRKSEAALALAQRVAHLGSWELDLENLVDINRNPLRWSDESYRIFGCVPGEFSVNNDAFFKIVHPADREKIAFGMAEMLRTGTPCSMDHRIILPGGGERVVHENAKLIFDENSKRPVKIAGTVQDITERKANEEAFREQAQLLNLAHDAIIVRGLDNRISFWNHGAEELYGWSASEAVGKSVKELIHPADAVAFDLATEQLMAAGKWSGEMRKVTQTGHPLTVEARWTLLRDEHGNPKAILAINTDITEKKKLEAQFLRAQRMESIGTVASGVAHDLNNALAPIMMGVELIKMQYPDQSQIIDMFQSSAQRGAEMVRQLLTFAKGAEGERVSVQANHLIKEMCDLIKGSFPKNIQMIVKCDPKLATVLGDATQIHQILLNLCVNARDAMPNGGTLTLEAQGRDIYAVYACSEPGAKPGPYVV